MNNLEFNVLAIQAAKRARANGISQSQIAAALSVSQSQVSRVLSGVSKRHTRLVDEICIYINNMHEITPSSVLENSEITDAIASVWDGSSGHAHAIAEVIRSLSAFEKTSHIAQSKNDYQEDAR
ncbi:MAG: helix-turn-helix transcriptional regulator [Methylotenera sp.]|uniref:helix-turn-helix transcriptional regulator n=1 Tax=Methylotenera sp. TaxID=2051956 RepID=UPI00248A5DA5|nr:helix-turn-helix transcriptional regulator [Methylotenera sp.]MDI1310456.1 helix-turn-helix transcriptional regulator [Methylotenera sp.]